MGIVLALRKLERNEIALFLNDPSPKVVTEAARAINDQPITGAMEALAKLITQPATDHAPLLRRVLNANYRFGTPATAKALANFAAMASAPESLRAEALDALALWPSNPGRDRVTGLWRPTAFARNTTTPSDALNPLAVSLLTTTPNKVRAAAARAAGTLKLTQAGPSLVKLIIDPQADGATRVDALRALSLLQTADYAEGLAAAAKDPDEKVRSLATKLAVEQPPLTQKATPATAATAATGLATLESVLLSGTLIEKQGALATLAGLPGLEVDALITAWMNRVLAGTVPAELQLDVLDAAAKRPSLKSLLAKYEAALDPKDPTARWKVSLLGGNAEEGKKIFAERAEVSCIRCHKISGEGGEVGPELTGLGKKNGRAYLLNSIVFPNAAIAQGFENILVTLKGGQAYAGIIKSESTDELLLNSPEDGLVKIKKTEIQSREKSLSGMPEGFGELLSGQDLRHLIEYLATAE